MCARAPAGHVQFHPPLWRSVTPPQKPSSCSSFQTFAHAVHAIARACPAPGSPRPSDLVSRCDPPHPADLIDIFWDGGGATGQRMSLNGDGYKPSGARASMAYRTDFGCIPISGRIQAGNGTL